MPFSHLRLPGPRFTTSEEALPALEAACAAHPSLARFEVIGDSEEGRPLAGVTLGHGPRLVTLVAGAHADEPVGPETLRTLVLAGLDRPEAWGDLLERFTFRVVPHVNPDAEAKNRVWIERWPDLGAYLVHRPRERPGRDVEFGYPALRVENQSACRFLFGYRPIALHASLHGMGFSEGALLLIGEDWAGRVDGLKRGRRFSPRRSVAAPDGVGSHRHGGSVVQRLHLDETGWIAHPLPRGTGVECLPEALSKGVGERRAAREAALG